MDRTSHRFVNGVVLSYLRQTKYAHAVRALQNTQKIHTHILLK